MVQQIFTWYRPIKNSYSVYGGFQQVDFPPFNNTIHECIVLRHDRLVWGALGVLLLLVASRSRYCMAEMM